MINLLEQPEANAAHGLSAAARAVAGLHALAAGLGESLRCLAVRGLDDDGLLQVTTAVEVLGRRVDALRVAAAAEVADRSRPELGTGQLSAKRGCRTAGELLERLTLVSGPTAGRRMRLGTQLRTGRSLGWRTAAAHLPRHGHRPGRRSDRRRHGRRDSHRVDADAAVHRPGLGAGSRERAGRLGHRHHF
ncbi:hypothetical protein [Cryobacterium sp. TMT2-14]|uniref:hypothetical protein n=1 Tax=Cryobacterium sp. TMT2-14 TaxID=1259245 RepID=UPI00106B78CB|nr:hypothetical protein [Cryobacterium sp. TMT2-14]TFC32652.1 hypothetical protein E3O28_15820 [Cryobacterium sp. TMT2-14]